MAKKRWKLCGDNGVPRTITLNGGVVPHVVEAHTRGEAKALFKKVHGEKPTPGGKKIHTTRKRLPPGLRVRLESY